MSTLLLVSARYLPHTVRFACSRQRVYTKVDHLAGAIIKQTFGTRVYTNCQYAGLTESKVTGGMCICIRNLFLCFNCPCNL